MDDGDSGCWRVSGRPLADWQTARLLELTGDEGELRG